MVYDKSKHHTPYPLDKPLNIIIMKYQFTTEGSKSQTIYHKVTLYGPGSIEDREALWRGTVSTPLTHTELGEFIAARLFGVTEGWSYSVGVGDKNSADTIIGLDSLARILSNIKPLKQKVIISICGEKKMYELDADKLETLLKSLE